MHGTQGMGMLVDEGKQGCGARENGIPLGEQWYGMTGCSGVGYRDGSRRGPAGKLQGER